MVAIPRLNLCAAQLGAGGFDPGSIGHPAHERLDIKDRCPIDVGTSCGDGRILDRDSKEFPGCGFAQGPFDPNIYRDPHDDQVADAPRMQLLFQIGASKAAATRFL